MLTSRPAIVLAQFISSTLADFGPLLCVDVPGYKPGTRRAYQQEYQIIVVLAVLCRLLPRLVSSTGFLLVEWIADSVYRFLKVCALFRHALMRIHGAFLDL